MILTDTVKIGITYNNIRHYSNFYNNLKIGNKIEIKINQLPIGSHQLILSKCDICGKEKNIPYRDYLKSFNNLKIFTCNHCKNIKNENTKKEKYDNKNYYNKEKYKKTCLEKYGVENIFQKKEIKEQIKKDNLEKYGVEFASQVKEFKDKSKKTNIKRYGVDHHLKNNEILEKQYKTNLKKYGVKHVSQNKEIMDDIIKKSKITRRKTFLKKYENINIKEIDYDNKILIMKCDCGENHYFEIHQDLFYNRKLLKNSICTICNPIDSLDSDQENNLFNFIKENYNDEIILKNRNIVKPSELDIYLPKLNLAFEFNGLYWHSDFYKPKNYHLNKTEECEKIGIHLIHIYEDDWLYKQNIVKSRILNFLGKSNKIFARKCKIKEIDDNKIVKEFLENNHLQGFVGSKIKIGLFYNDELISIMTFGSLRKSLGQKSKENSYELLRFCNKLNTNVIGGASKLFKYFIKNYKPVEITSYADRSWSIGNLYEKLEFKFDHKTRPNYYYFKNKKRFHRFNFRKDQLIKNGAEPNKTEYEIMTEKGFYRIFDSGNLKFIWTS